MSELFTKKEAAKKLNTSVDTLNKMIDDGKVKTVVLNKRVKISGDEIEKMTTGKDKTIIDLASKLACAGYDIKQMEQIINIIKEVM